jgi:hypothetical protein
MSRGLRPVGYFALEAGDLVVAAEGQQLVRTATSGSSEMRHQLAENLRSAIRAMPM